MINLEPKSIPELLALHAQVSGELQARGVTRTANNPAGDLAKYLFCRAFGWEQAPNSERGFSATGKDGKRYRIKGRRLDRHRPSRLFSGIRELDHGHFSALAAVLFDDSYRVMRGALIPLDVVKKQARYNDHTNSHIFNLRDEVWHMPGVRDVTAELRAALAGRQGST